MAGALRLRVVVMVLGVDGCRDSGGHVWGIGGERPRVQVVKQRLSKQEAV